MRVESYIRERHSPLYNEEAHHHITFKSLPEYPSVAFASFSYGKFGSKFSFARIILSIFLRLFASGRSTYILYSNYKIHVNTLRNYFDEVFWMHYYLLGKRRITASSRSKGQFVAPRERDIPFLASSVPDLGLNGLMLDE